MTPAIVTRPSYKWWVFSTIAIGTFISVADHGAVNVALPRIETHFQTTLSTVQWVVVGYALTISILLLPMGRLGDMISRKRIYVAGMGIFVVASGLAASAGSMEMLIGAKVFQGVGSAMIQGTGMAMIISVFPDNERGKALGAHLSMVSAGLIAGTAVGGLLVSSFGWRSIFLFNIVFGLIAMSSSMAILDSRRLAAETPHGIRPRFDWLGAVLSGSFMLLFLLVISNGHRAGWTSAPILAGAVGAMTALALFIWWELRTDSPMLELRLFKRKLVALGVAASWIAFLANSATIFLMAFYLQKVLGYSPREAGLIVIPGAVCLAIAGLVSGRLSDRVGWRMFNVAGLTISAVALFALSRYLTVASPLTLIVPLLMLNSAGGGMFNTPNNNSILSAVERTRYGVVSALTQVTRNSANITSIALATTIVVATMGSMGFEASLDAVDAEGGGAVAEAFLTGLKRVYLVFGSLLIVGIVISYLKGDRAKEPSDQPLETVAAEPGGRPA